MSVQVNAQSVFWDASRRQCFAKFRSECISSCWLQAWIFSNWWVPSYEWKIKKKKWNIKKKEPPILNACRNDIYINNFPFIQLLQNYIMSYLSNKKGMIKISYCTWSSAVQGWGRFFPCHEGIFVMNFWNFYEWCIFKMPKVIQHEDLHELFIQLKFSNNFPHFFRLKFFWNSIW